MAKDMAEIKVAEDGHEVRIIDPYNPPKFADGSTHPDRISLVIQNGKVTHTYFG